jgi:cellulose synthase/poly-beta-1,6-N-acetylglucosamine synthase-like glycosyltransferase
MMDLPGIQVFWFAILLDVCRIILFDIVAYRSRRAKQRARRQTASDGMGRRPLVSVVIPGFNEEKTLETTVASVLGSYYPNLEVIIVDDGSTDETPRVARRLTRDRRVRCVRQKRGGKSTALNLGLLLARGELMFQVDSDCFLHADAIPLLVREFDDPRVDGACGRVQIYEPLRNLVTRLQAIEFIMSFGAGRMAADALGITKVISGSFGMWRISALRDIGLWDHPMGEDGDLTLKVRKKRGRLVYCPQAVCENRVRDTWKGLTRQRYRWNRNYIKNRFRKHLDIANPAVFGWSNFWMFVDSSVYRVVLFVMILAGLGSMLFTDPAGALGHLGLVALFYTFVSSFQYPYDVWLISREKRTDLALFVWLPLLHPYRFFLRLVQLASFVAETFFYQSYSSHYLPREIAERSVKW